MFKKTIALTGLTLLFLSPLGLQAAPDTSAIPGPGIGELESNLKIFGGKTGLSNAAGQSDLKGTIANIINIILGFLGIIAVIMLLIAGYRWMMAGGNEQTVTDAKNQVKNAIIGLVIVFMAWVIVGFTVNQLRSATNNRPSSAPEGGASDGGSVSL